MRKKWLFRAGAVMLAGILASSEMTAFPVLAQEGGVPETVSWEPGDGQNSSEEGQNSEHNDGSGKGRGEEEGSGVEDFREVLPPASVSGNDVSSGDVGFSGKDGGSDMDEGSGAEIDEGTEKASTEIDEVVEETGAETDEGTEESDGEMEESYAEGVEDIEDSMTVSDFSLLGSTETTVYTIGGVEYDISTAEFVDSGAYCGISWQLYDNGLMCLTGDQTGDISLSNYSRAPWYNKSAVKAVYLNFNTNGHALQRMFWNSGIVGAALGSDFNMAGTSDISSMFSGCSNLTDFDFTGQDFSSVVTMESIFGNCSSITSITFGEGIDTGNLENLAQAFLQCSKLSSVDVWNLYVGKVTTLYNTFSGCSTLTELDLSGWDTRQVTTAQYAFQYCSGLKSLNIRDWKLPNLQSAACMFAGASGLTELDISGWETSEKLNNLYAMFRYCGGLKSVTFGTGMDTSGVTNLAELFNQCGALGTADLSMFSTKSCTRADSVFANAAKLASVTFGEGFHLDRASTVEKMFYECSSLTELDLTMWTGGSITDMTNLFYGCSKLTQVDFGDSFDAGTVKKMTRLFFDCDALESIDLSNWQVSSLEDISYGFYNCDKLENVNLSGWETSSLTTMTSLFMGSSKLKTVNMRGWNTEKVTSVSLVFQYCSSLETVVTPTKNGTRSISLPKTMYDWDDNDASYTALPVGTEESITLHSTRSYSYTVVISAGIVLTPEEEGSRTYVGSYDITVTGYCYADGKCIAVVPGDGSVTLAGENGEEVTGMVSQHKRYLTSNVDAVISSMTNEEEKGQWIGLSESGTAFTGDVRADFSTPGNYSGTVNF